MEMINFCDPIYTECPAYLVTLNDDDELGRKTIAKWSEMYKFDIKPEAINCNGCTSEWVKFHHCAECEIRLYGIASEVKNCGRCANA